MASKELKILDQAVADCMNSINKIFLDLGRSKIKEGIGKIIFNPKTNELYIKWRDGDITKAKCSNKDEFDFNVGFSIAVAAKVFGSKTKLHKYVKEVDIINA